jgi:polyisoprenoid-binding protein YceI
MPTLRFRSALRLLCLGLALAACASAPTATPTPAQATVPTEPPLPSPGTAAMSTSTAEAGPVAVYSLMEEATEVRFLIDEILRGAPNTVRGSTHRVLGEIQIDLGAPERTIVSPIQVEAGDLATDSSLRDRAIRNFILRTSAFPQIVFTPTAIAGLPSSAAAGDSFSFTITGGLTIRDVTHPVTFEVNLTAETADRVTGLATATILRSDYGLTIPSVPNVADVGEDVRLELEFEAVRQE